MFYTNNMVKDIKIAYIGGGSRGWAWTLMNDLKKAEDISGTVYLYDIDYPAAQTNEVIGNRIDGENWKYKAVDTIGEALTGADFVIISILPEPLMKWLWMYTHRKNTVSGSLLATQPDPEALSGLCVQYP